MRPHGQHDHTEGGPASETSLWTNSEIMDVFEACLFSTVYNNNQIWKKKQQQQKKKGRGEKETMHKILFWAFYLASVQ